MIKKYVSKRFAEKMILVGAIMVIITTILGYIILWYAYGNAGKLFETSTPETGAMNSLTVWNIVAKINYFAQIAGLTILGLGIFSFIVARIKQKP